MFAWPRQPKDSMLEQLRRRASTWWTEALSDKTRWLPPLCLYTSLLLLRCQIVVDLGFGPTWAEAK